MHQSRRTVARGPCRSCLRATCASAVLLPARSACPALCLRSRCSRLALGWRRHPLVKGPVARVSWQPLPAFEAPVVGEVPRHYFSRASSAVAAPEAAMLHTNLTDLPFCIFILGEHVRVLGSRIPQASARTFDASFELGQGSIRIIAAGFLLDKSIVARVCRAHRARGSSYSIIPISRSCVRSCANCGGDVDTVNC